MLTSLFLQPSCYVLSQGYHQNNLINASLPTEQVLRDPETPIKTKDKLELVREILAFADATGLNVGDSYRHFVSTDDRPISYSLAVAPSLEMKLKKWWFPVVGSVPYLGYFDEQERDTELQKFQAEGFDVHTSSVAAFSSLGWFPDPIFQSYLKRSDYRLARLILHELTHRTLWLPGKVRFNENFAEFVAIKLASLFFIQKGRKTEVQSQLASKSDRELFKKWLMSLKKRLSTLYQNKTNATDASQLKKKAEIIFEMTTTSAPKFSNPKFLRLIDRPWNNASILATSLYVPDYSAFEKALQCSKSKNIAEFLHLLEQHRSRLKDEDTIEEVFCNQIG